MFPLDSNVFKACIQPINKSYLFYLQNINQITSLTCGQPQIQSIHKQAGRQTDRQIDMHTPEILAVPTPQDAQTYMSVIQAPLPKRGRNEAVHFPAAMTRSALYSSSSHRPPSHTGARVCASPSKEAPVAHPLHVIFHEETHSPRFLYCDLSLAHYLQLHLSDNKSRRVVYNTGCPVMFQYTRVQCLGQGKPNLLTSLSHFSHVSRLFQNLLCR